MGTFGTPEILLIIAAIVLFFGASKIPELARGLGQGITEFKKASDDSEKEDDGKRERSEVSEDK